MNFGIDSWKYFPKKSTYFLKKQWDEYNKIKPFKGLSILSNLHLTKATICKLEPLLVSGANLKVTATKDLNTDSQVIDYYSQQNVYINPEEIQKYQYDIVLDCGASLIDSINPKFGFIELTKSSNLENIKHKKFNYIDIDKTQLKEIENLYGTGDGFLRAIKSQLIHLENKAFMVIGYGKVGQGIVKALSKYTKDIIVIEIDKIKIEQARNHGLKVFNIEDHQKIKSELQSTFLAVTATGEKGIVSKYFDEKDFKDIYKANMGTYDEWGEIFSETDILGNKKPLNFTLSEPTEMKYLDPVFYAHNHSIQLLLNTPNKIGQIFFPNEKDQEIVSKWLSIHNFNF